MTWNKRQHEGGSRREIEFEDELFRQDQEDRWHKEMLERNAKLKLMQEASDTFNKAKKDHTLVLHLKSPNVYLRKKVVEYFKECNK